MDIKEKIKLLIEKDIAILGYSIWGIEVSGNSISKLIRLFIDKNKGKIDLLDCEKVSNQVVDLLTIVIYLILNIDWKFPLLVLREVFLNLISTRILLETLLK